MKHHKAKMECHKTKYVVTVVVNDPDTGHEVEIEVRKDIETNMFFGVEGAFVASGFTHVTELYTGKFLLEIATTKSKAES